MNKNYKFRKFADGWWSVINYSGIGWGQWRGPFKTKADAEVDCANATRGRYEL